MLFPEVVDDYIADANPVRFIDVYVDGLDLEALGFKYATPKETGRPPYQPGDLLKLYIYGYLNKIRSSRKLEHETHRTVEVMWLWRRLRPAFKTMADFRQDHSLALKQVCRDFTLLGKRRDLCGQELIAIDGSKFKAVNSKERHFGEKKLKRLLQQINEKIHAYLNELDENDHFESQAKTPTADELKAKSAHLRSRQGQYQQVLETRQAREDLQLSLTDAARRAMKTSQGLEVCYHVQMAVDAKHKLIGAHAVTHAVTDQDQLAPMAKQATEVFDADRLEVVTAMGYDNGDDVKKCLEDGIVPYLSKPQTSATSTLGLFGQEEFSDNPEKDCYRCPAGQD